MDRLARFDASSRFRGKRGKVAAQIGFGAISALTMILIRSAIDVIAPSAGPFALVYPTVVIATLFGHWRGGLAAWLISFFWAWYIVLPFNNSFDFELATDPSRVAINAASCLVIIGFSEAFRRAVEVYGDQLEAAAQRRLTLLAELEHRTKNNFALVAGLLEIQRRRQQDPKVSEALEDASRRVMTFADAYSNLAEEQAEGAEVTMKPYLDHLTKRLAAASFSDSVEFKRAIDDLTLPREQGVAIGLYLNEALANCAKYAFPDGRPGVVQMDFKNDGETWVLLLSDDGIGKHAELSDHSSGLGTQLMEIFADQAGARHTVTFGEKGCVVELRGPIRR